jgi:hypothetical protein
VEVILLKLIKLFSILSIMVLAFSLAFAPPAAEAVSLDRTCIDRDASIADTAVAPTTVNVNSERAVYAAVEVDIGDRTVARTDRAPVTSTRMTLPASATYLPPIEYVSTYATIDQARPRMHGFNGLGGDHFARADV